MSVPRQIHIPDAEAMETLGAALADAWAGCLADTGPQGLVFYLQGDLGAGKTTLVRGLLRRRGHQGPVKSPTYTLVEPYELPGEDIYHFDLYRLSDPQELEYLGARDYFAGHALCLIEWPERAAGALPPADLRVQIRVEGRGRAVELQAGSERGERVLEEADLEVLL